MKFEYDGTMIDYSVYPGPDRDEPAFVATPGEVAYFNWQPVVDGLASLFDSLYDTVAKSVTEVFTAVPAEFALALAGKTDSDASQVADLLDKNGYTESATKLRKHAVTNKRYPTSQPEWERKFPRR